MVFVIGQVLEIPVLRNINLETCLSEPVLSAMSEGLPYLFFSWPLTYLVVKGWLLSHWTHFSFYLDTCFHSYSKALSNLGWDQIRESFVSGVRVSSEAVIFRKVLQTLIIKCFGTFLEILGYALRASTEKGMSRGWLLPHSPLLGFRLWR